MTAPTPRVATSLDDLKVGQVVAWLPADYVGDSDEKFIGTVQRRGTELVMVTADGYDLFELDNGQTFILSEPDSVPAEPVSVDREAFDRLAEAIKPWRGVREVSTFVAEAIALVDSADSVRAAER